MNHDYDKVLKNRIHDKSVPVRDTYQQLKTAQKKKSDKYKRQDPEYIPDLSKIIIIDHDSDSMNGRIPDG